MSRIHSRYLDSDIFIYLFFCSVGSLSFFFFFLTLVRQPCTLHTVFFVSRGPSPTEKRKPRCTPPAFACALKVERRSCREKFHSRGLLRWYSQSGTGTRARTRAPCAPHGYKRWCFIAGVSKCDTDNCEDSAFDAGEHVVHPLSLSSTRSD